MSPNVPLLLGVDYYPDQTPESLWEEDARMMADFGFTNVRVAEFAWSLMEPSEGKFDFAWLHRSVEILHKHGIGVILGTPSAAPPPWLTQKYPEVLMVNDEGMTVSPGGRRFTCPSNKTYRKLSLAIATEMSRSFRRHAGSHRLADRQRIHVATVGPLLLQILPRGISGMAARKIRQPRYDQLEVGHGVLEPDLYRLQPDSRAAAVERRSESGARARLRPVSVLRKRIVFG